MDAENQTQNNNASKSALDAERLKAKEKKRTRRDSASRNKETVTVSSVTNGSAVMNGASKRSGKFGDRKSRSLYGRGLPKKGGGGGKGTWGKLGDELEQVSYLDDHDPNYDSEQDDAVTYKPVKPEWNRDEIEKTVIPILMEYFEHGAAGEVTDALGDINIQDKKALVVICLVTLAMEKKNEYRELASQLLLALTLPKQHVHMNGNSGNHSGQLGRAFLNTEDIRLGFLSLCDDLPDLVLDTPDAAQVLAKFIARAVFDHVLNQNIIDVLSDDPEFELSMLCAKEAHCLLHTPHFDWKRQIWGKAGGIQPLDVLKKKMTTLLKEYLSSGDSEEAMRCVTELDVPHYHHELVYEALLMAIEVSTERAGNMLVHLLKRFSDTTIVTADQLTQGFVRIYNEMPDVNLDVPNAYFYLEQMVNKCYDLKVISIKLKVQAPNRSRKRFVSEGDGGKLKNYRNDKYFDLV